MSGFVDVLLLVYLGGVVLTAALGIVASDRLRSDWPDIVFLAVSWPLFLLLYLSERR